MTGANHHEFCPARASAYVQASGPCRCGYGDHDGSTITERELRHRIAELERAVTRTAEDRDRETLEKQSADRGLRYWNKRYVAAEARATRAEAALERVRALHSPVHVPARNGLTDAYDRCSAGCTDGYPCPTVAALDADAEPAAGGEFHPILAAQGPAKPAGNSAAYEPDDEDAVRAVHDDCDPGWCASEGHQVCGYAVLIDALGAERAGRADDRDPAAWAAVTAAVTAARLPAPPTMTSVAARVRDLATQRDDARGLAAALEAELARVRDAVNVGATPALIAEILDEALDG